MFCKKCGHEINDEAQVCVHCGCMLEKKSGGESKAGLGVVMALFLGIMGLIIGICMYSSDSVERSTFIKGWGITFGVSFVAGLVIWLILLFSLSAYPY